MQGQHAGQKRRWKTMNRITHMSVVVAATNITGLKKHELSIGDEP
jgi:hypothetical protein